MSKKKPQPRNDTDPRVLHYPAELAQRADILLERWRKNDDNILAGMKRSSILRLALKKGLEVLERDSGPTYPSANGVKAPPSAGN